MATLQSGKCFTVPTFFGMCCRSEWQERMYIYKWHEVDQTKHEIFCVHIVCNEIQVKVNLEITTFFFYLRFPYCHNFFWFRVVYTDIYIYICVCVWNYVAGTSKNWKRNHFHNETAQKMFPEKWEFYILYYIIYYNILSVHNSLSSLLWLEYWYDWFVTLHRSFKHCLQRLINSSLWVVDLILLNQVLDCNNIVSVWYNN